MSGHSKWSTIKRQKGATDAKRGAAFTKMANAITITAREGGGNPESNFKLRLAMEEAKKINMPKENVERAISRGTGQDKEAVNIEEIIYEGFGPEGIGVVVEAVTDNRQRTVQEVRSTFDRNGGNLGGPGSVAHLFKPIGEIIVTFNKDLDPDDLFLKAADAGADDVETGTNEATIYCDINNLESVKNNLSGQGLEIEQARVSRKPATVVKITDEKKAEAVLNLVNKLDDLEDVQKVYSNFDIAEDILERNTVT